MDSCYHPKSVDLSAPIDRAPDSPGAGALISIGLSHGHSPPCIQIDAVHVVADMVPPVFLG